MPGYNHYPWCTCGWCIGGGGQGYGNLSSFSSSIPTSRVSSTSQTDQARTYRTTCPWCSAEVYYHTNGYGDSVFFDSLGSPWKVHGCWEEYRDQTKSVKLFGLKVEQVRYLVLAGAIRRLQTEGHIPTEKGVAIEMGISVEDLRQHYKSLYVITSEADSQIVLVKGSTGDLGSEIEPEMIAIPGGRFQMGDDELNDAKLVHSVSIKSVGSTRDLGNGIEPEMIAILGGRFQMGDDELNYAKPVHSVSVKPVFMGKYPITQKQYQAVMGTNPSCFKGVKRPVDNVSWHDAMEFCRRLSQKTGKNYRLPSEAEWEYACRAGTQTKYYFGDNKKQLGNYAWYGGNSKSRTHPVGQKKPNQFGLYDMHGNVWEWCSDRWHENYEDAPTDGSSWESKENKRVPQPQRVIRGGAWDNSAEYCCTGNRLRRNPVKDYYYCGFRVAFNTF